MTRLVKKPRPSLTTIGVLPIRRPRSKARASAASPVCSPTTISSSGIRSTGEKKCMPMKSAGRLTPVARPVIGSVEVFEASSAPGASTGSTSANTGCFSAGSSKTASMTASQPASAATSAVAVIRASTAAARSASSRPLPTSRASSFSAWTRAPAGGPHGDVLEDDVQAGAGARVRDPGAHHARTQHRHPGHRGDLDRPAGLAPPLTALQVEEERADHVLGDLPGQQADQYRVSIGQRGVQVDLGALDRGGQDRLGRRQPGTLELLAQGGRERRQLRGQRRLAGVPPGIR